MSDENPRHHARAKFFNALVVIMSVAIVFGVVLGYAVVGSVSVADALTDLLAPYLERTIVFPERDAI